MPTDSRLVVDRVDRVDRLIVDRIRGTMFDLNIIPPPASDGFVHCDLPLNNSYNYDDSYATVGDMWIDARCATETPDRYVSPTFEELDALRNEGDANHYSPDDTLIYVGLGGLDRQLSRYWGFDLYNAAGTAGVSGTTASARYFVKKHTWFRQLRNKMFTPEQETALQRISEKYNKGNVALAAAKNAAKKLFDEKYDFVWADDVMEMLPKEFCYQDEITLRFIASDVDMVNICVAPDEPRKRCHRLTADRIGFYCDHTSCFYSSRNFTSVVVDGYRCCKEVCILHTWSDGSLHFVPEPDNLASYHSVERKWNKEAVEEKIGIELEIYTAERGAFNRTLPGKTGGIFGEQDGSLHEQNGIELVGAPFDYSDYYDETKCKWKEVLDSAIKHKGCAFNTPDGKNYGMHVSLSRNMFVSNFHLAKFVVFFNTQADLCKMIAQRDIIYSGDYYRRVRIISKQEVAGGVISIDQYARRVRDKFIITTDKYEAVKVETKRVEVRIFRANLSYERFLKNIEFCMAVKDYTEFASAVSVAKHQGENTGTKLFLQWLSEQSGYKNLRKFLNERALTDRHINGISTFKRTADAEMAKKYTKEITNI